MNRTTETLYLRMDPALVRAVKQLARDRNLTHSELAEEALRSYVSDSTDADHRAKLLQATEEALLARVEGRFNRLASNIQGLYAKEALDIALAVELLKQLLAMGVREERQLSSLINGARQEAHRRVTSRTDWKGPLPPEIEEKLAKLAQEKAALLERIQQLKEQLSDTEAKRVALLRGQEELREARDSAQGEARTAEMEVRRIMGCIEGAIKEFEAQGMIKRRSIREIFEQWRDR